MVNWTEFAEREIGALPFDLRTFGAWGMLRSMLTKCGECDPTLEDIRAAFNVADALIQADPRRAR